MHICGFLTHLFFSEKFWSWSGFEAS